tara:strand:- start:3510 stop:3737 length:228 start_codon:yes stop_codon:yes gene_type:complete
MGKVKNYMMDMEELVDCAVCEGADDFKEVANFVLNNYKPMSFVDIEYCKTYYNRTMGEVTAQKESYGEQYETVNF